VKGPKRPPAARHKPRVEWNGNDGNDKRNQPGARSCTRSKQSKAPMRVAQKITFDTLLLVLFASVLSRAGLR
jgi:hypothetical protein